MHDSLTTYDTTALLRELTRRLERYWVDDPRRQEASLTVERWRWHARRRNADVLPRLSPREQQIAAMVADGDTNKVVAHRLEISSWTVAAHLRRIYEKLDVHTRAAMVARLREDHGNAPWPLEAEIPTPAVAGVGTVAAGNLAPPGAVDRRR